MLGNKSSMLISLLRTKVPGEESSRERRFQGTKVPENDSSRERKFHESTDPTPVLFCSVTWNYFIVPLFSILAKSTISEHPYLCKPASELFLRRLDGFEPLNYWFPTTKLRGRLVIGAEGFLIYLNTYHHATRTKYKAI